MLPFNAQSKTQKLSVTASASASVSLPSIGNQIRIVSEPGSATAFFSVGTGSQTATVPVVSASTPVATCTPVLGGSDVVFTIPKPEASSTGGTGGGFTAPTALNISAICDGTGTATLWIQVGEGA